MATKITNATGSGSIKDDSLISFSYSEDVTSLEPSNLTGGVGQVTISGIVVKEEKIGNTHPASKLLINNEIVLTDSVFGSVQFQAESVSVGNEVVSVTGSTLHERLNVTRTAGPHGGTGSTLWTAIVYYCSLVGITPQISSSLQTTLDAISVNFIGWQGNVWEHLKMLCAAVSINTSGNVGLEMYINNNQLVFRQALSSEIDLTESLEDISISISSIDTAQNIDVYKYETIYGVNRVIAEEGRGPLTAATRNVTIDDRMQVDAGETLVKRFKINASLESVNQPTVVSAITQLPYPLTGGFGEYVVVGNDDLPIQPSQWVAQGGSLTVSITENPNEIELVIVAPPAPSLQTADNPTIFTSAPYKIGVESSGNQEYPALYLTGTGVFFEKKVKSFITGASNDYTAKQNATEIDNPFLITDHNVSTRGVAAAQAQCGPQITLNMSVDSGVQFGNTIGKVFSYESNKYRLSSIQFSDSSTSIIGVGCAKISDFNAKWTGKTFTNFKSIALDPAIYPTQALTFNEFSVIPLMEAQ